MKLTINPKIFQNEFVAPIEQLTREGRIAVFTDGDQIYSVSGSKTSSDTIKLYNTYKPFLIEDPIPRFSINVARLQKALACLNSEEMITLDISTLTGTCNFSSKEIKFSIKLLDNNMVTVPKFNVEVFKQFPMDFTLPICRESVQQIHKALTFSSETGKFYIEQEEDEVYFTFGDKNDTANVTDSMRILIAKNITDEIPNKIYDAEVLGLILRTKTDFSMKLARNGVMFIEIENNNSNLKYLTAPLKK